MELPGDSIGITDILQYRECPRRFSYGMRRHVGAGEQNKERIPEHQNEAAAYGSAIHDAIQAMEEGTSLEDAVQVAWNAHGVALQPSDVQLLRDDLELYQARDFPGTRTIASEDEFRVPLMRWNGRQIWFRFKLDRLYERIDQPGTWIHVDYKSSKWAKSEKEVHEDPQMWAYNFAIHEYWPECDRLLQIYDQLRYGQEDTGKTPTQRAQIKDWLIKQATAILEDDDVRDDGLMRHKKNDWCAWCPVMESCPVLPELTDFALTRIAALSPRRPKLKKDGTESKVLEDVPLDPAKAETYVEVYEDAKKAIRVLKRYQDSVGALLRDLPEDERRDLGYELMEKTQTDFPPEAIRTLRDRLGPAFDSIPKITKTSLAEFFGDDKEGLEWALSLGVREKGATSVVRSGNP